MVGMEMMLKSMGFDVGKMKEDITGFLSRIEERFDALEKRCDKLENMMQNEGEMIEFHEDKNNVG